MGKWIGDVYSSGAGNNQHYSPAIYIDGNSSPAIVRKRPRRGRRLPSHNIVQKYNGGGNMANK